MKKYFIIFISILLSGCVSLPNPYIQIPKDQKLIYQKTNNKIQIHIFSTLEKKEAIKNEPGGYYDLHGDVYSMCNKKLFPTPILYKTSINIIFYLFTIGFFASSPKAKSINTEKIHPIINLDSKFEIIDDTNNYENENEFIKACKKNNFEYFVIINCYNLKNVNILVDKNSQIKWVKDGTTAFGTDTYSTGLVMNYFYGTGYISAYSFDIYKTFQKKSKKIFHYQQIFYPKKFHIDKNEKINIGSDFYNQSKIYIFEDTMDEIIKRRDYSLVENLKKFFNGYIFEKNQEKRKNFKQATTDTDKWEPENY